MALPEVKIMWAGMPARRCAVCGEDWPDHETPTFYTAESVAADFIPEPVCDFCIRDRYPPERFQELLADRERFYAN